MLYHEEFMMKAPVNKIIPFSNVDGPGNRLSVFFQGCLFRCWYCHNPETIHQVDKCAICLENKRIKEEGLDISLLKECKALRGSNANWMSVEDVMEHIKEVEPYIRGITVSGGECMLHADFLLELAREIKTTTNLTFLIDSCGYIDFKDHQELLEYCDGVMLDVKAWNPEFHKKLTGQRNDNVISNLKYLLEMNKLHEVRTVVLPRYEEFNEETIINVSKIIKDKTDYKLLKYRQYGVRDIGIEKIGRSSPTEDLMNSYIKLANSHGATSTYFI